MLLPTKEYRRPSLLLASWLAAFIILLGSSPLQAAQTTKRPSTANDFEAVTSQLEKGGDVYLYLNTRQWLEELSGKIKSIGGGFAQVPGMGAEEKKKLEAVVDVVSKLVVETGLEGLAGVGFSGVRADEELYRTRMVMHRGANATGWMWSAFGKTPHDLTLFKALPAESAMASAGDVDLSLILESLEKQIAESGIPELQQGWTEFKKGFQQGAGFSWSDFLGTWGGEFALALTMDTARPVSIPLGPSGVVSIPEPGLVIVIKVKNELLYTTAAAKLKAIPSVILTQTNGSETITVPVPVPIPVSLRPSISRQGDYLLIASTDTLLEKVRTGIKTGQGGIASTDEFKLLSKGIDLKGNSATFVSQRFTDALAQVQKTAMAAAGPNGPPEALLQLFGWGRPHHTLSVSSVTPTGWLVTSRTTEHPAMVVAAPLLIAPAAIGAGMVLPALAKAKSKAQSIQCVNNLKQIGLAARIYATDNKDVLPKDWLSMTNEMSTPLILHCPQDTAHPALSNWSQVTPETISYELVSPGATETDVSKVYARCRVHGHTVLVDGSVQQAPHR